MALDKTSRQNRVREALGKLYDEQPPYFREYLRRFREDPTSRVFAPLAEAYRRLGRLDEGIEICREGLQHHPDFHSGRVALAKCLIDKMAYREARDELERVVKSVPENLLAQRLLGQVCEALDDLPASLHAYKMALLLSPNDVVLSEKVHSIERGQFSSGSFSRAKSLDPAVTSGQDEAVNIDLRTEWLSEPHSSTEVPTHSVDPTGRDFSDSPNRERPTPPILPSADEALQKARAEHVAELLGEDVESESPGSSSLAGGPEAQPVDKEEEISHAGQDVPGMQEGFQGAVNPDSLSPNVWAPERSAVSQSDEESLDELDEVHVSDRLPPQEAGTGSHVDEILGMSSEGASDDGFSVEHISAVFGGEISAKGKEITTETLGDLYLSQQQFERALRIFEKLQMKRPSPELARKIHTCQVRLGVDEQALERKHKIQILKRVLNRLTKGQPDHGRPQAS